VTQLSNAIARWQQVRVALDGLSTFAASEQERDVDRQYSRRNVLKGDIIISDLRFAYAEDQDVVLKDQLVAALEFSGLWPMVQRHPMGMDMPLSDGGVGLSVGQRQSLGLARIFLADPQIVLLDEPTSAMDQTLEAETIANLRDWLSNKTCVLTTHRTEIVGLCDRIAVLQEGQLALIGPRDEVIQKLQRKDPK